MTDDEPTGDLRMGSEGLYWGVTAIPRHDHSPVYLVRVRGMRAGSLIDEERDVSLGQLTASIEELCIALGVELVRPGHRPGPQTAPVDLTEANVEQTIAAKQERVTSIDAEIAALTRRRGALMDQLRSLGRAAAGRHTGLARRIEEVMEREPDRGWKARELVQCLGGTVNGYSVAAALTKMRESGRLERIAVGLYRVARRQEQAA